MHPIDRLYLVTAWSYILAFHLTCFALSFDSSRELLRLWADPEI